MSSGVLVSADCQNAFQQLAEGRGKLRYIIFKIEGKEVTVESSVGPEELGLTGDDYEENSKTAYDMFVKDLRERTNGFADCRYAVFDFKFSCNRPGAGTSKMDKLVFIQVFASYESVRCMKLIYLCENEAVCRRSKFISVISTSEDGYKTNLDAGQWNMATAQFQSRGLRPAGMSLLLLQSVCTKELCPDGAPIKKKMVYASSASAIKQSLGTAKILQFQVSDEAEISHKELLNKLSEKYRDN